MDQFKYLLLAIAVASRKVGSYGHSKLNCLVLEPIVNEFIDDPLQTLTSCKVFHIETELLKLLLGAFIDFKCYIRFKLMSV